MSDDLVVTQDIPFNNGTVYAYRAGDKISRDVVEANDWQDYVAMPAAKKTAASPSTNSGS